MEIKFFSIPENEKSYYLGIINSVNSQYYDGINLVEIHNREKSMLSVDGLYIPYAGIIKIIAERGNVLNRLKHELTHHKLFKKDGKMTSENLNHGRDFQMNLIQ